MIDLDLVAYLMLGLSASASAVQIGRWMLTASPRTIVTAGRWSLAAFVVLTPLALLWLIVSGRTTLAMMFAAFILPVFVQGGLRWRSLLPPLRLTGAYFPGGTSDLRMGLSSSRSGARYPIDADLVRQSVAVLEAYLEHFGSQRDRRPTKMRFASGPINGSGNGFSQRMSLEEAFDALGLDPAASLQEIREASRRLEQKVDPQVGGTRYLASKVIEAKDVLLDDWGCRNNLDRRELYEK